MAVAERAAEQEAINTIRTLAMDAVEAAKSGHPGTPMALAPVGYLLWNEVLRFDPADAAWPNRDRFILSCGHASTLLYSLLHLAGVRQLDAQDRPTSELAVPLDDLRRFRQLGSRCPGHPEHRHTSGVETTTGPLGQGIGNSLGMAIAARWLGAQFNRPGLDLFDFNVYALCSDGDLMEGLSAEVASLAGHLKLANLCWIYDDNQITIEGRTSLAFSENVAARFAASGWNVLRVADANDLPAIRKAIEGFHNTTDRPTLIIVRSVIAWGAPNKHDTSESHGAPLGSEEVRLTKAAYGWPDEQFRVPEAVRTMFREGIGRRGAASRQAWQAKWEAYGQQYPQQAEQLRQILQGKLPEGWDAEIKPFPSDPKGMATRSSSGKVLNQVAKRLPWLLGGSADLAPSTNTLLANGGDVSADNPCGRNFHFGVREHAMGALCNGLALCGLRPFGATFFVFSDYMRPSIRLAALMGLPVLYVFTHDSIGVGEDGPTHQPVEQLAALRGIPNLVVLRPGDANEVAEAYKAVLRLKDRPAAMVLTRQNLPTLDRSQLGPAEGVARGGYILADAPGGTPQVILLACGSELSVCLEARKLLAAEGVEARVVSMPSWELFDEQPEAYRHAVLPPAITRRVAVEAGVEMGWQKYIGLDGRFVGMQGYGASGPYATLMKHFGLTPDNVAEQAKSLLTGC